MVISGVDPEPLPEGQHPVRRGAGPGAVRGRGRGVLAEGGPGDPDGRGQDRDRGERDQPLRRTEAAGVHGQGSSVFREKRDGKILLAQNINVDLGGLHTVYI